MTYEETIDAMKRAHKVHALAIKAAEAILEAEAAGDVPAVVLAAMQLAVDIKAVHEGEAP